MEFLLISRYRYFILSSSPPSVFSSKVNGGTLDLLSISISCNVISISPVPMLGFLDSLSLTDPVTETTYSLPIFLTCSTILFDDSFVSMII